MPCRTQNPGKPSGCRGNALFGALFSGGNLRSGFSSRRLFFSCGLVDQELLDRMAGLKDGSERSCFEAALRLNF